jgi:hypothetical protein
MIMSETVPTADELQRLPLRAVAAYAVRTARRVAVHLNHAVPTEVLDQVLDRSETIVRMPDSRAADRSSLMYAVSRLYGSLNTTDNRQPLDWIGPHLCLARSARVVDCLVEAARAPWRAEKQMQRAARLAEAAVRSVKGRLVGGVTVAELARRDYELLVAKGGLHEAS